MPSVPGDENLKPLGIRSSPESSLHSFQSLQSIGSDPDWEFRRQQTKAIAWPFPSSPKILGSSFSAIFRVKTSRHSKLVDSENGSAIGQLILRLTCCGPFSDDIGCGKQLPRMSSS